MKPFFTFLLLFVSFSSIAQIKYECPYVTEGKSFELTIPSGFYLINDMGSEKFYSTNPNASIENMEDGPTDNLLVVGIFEAPYDYTSYDYVKEFENDPEFKLIAGTNEKEVGDYLFVHASYKIDAEDLKLPAAHFGILAFEGVMATVVLFEKHEGSTPKFTAAYDKMLSSFKAVETERDNDFFAESGWDDEDYDFFSNEYFETNLHYEDVFFEGEEDENWSEDMGMDYPELLVAFYYFNNDDIIEGRVKVFSGGEISNYGTDQQKVDALQLVFPYNEITGITKTGSVQGNEFSFEKYAVQSSRTPNTAVALYTTTYDNELIFILLDKTDEGSSAFASYGETFVKTMWVWVAEEIDYEFEPESGDE